MIWLVFFVSVFLFFLGILKIFNYMFDKAAAIRAEKRAKKHFQTSERFRRSIV